MWLLIFITISNLILCLRQAISMMTSSSGNILHVTGPLWGESTWRSPVDSPHKGQWRGTLAFSLICACTNGWANNRDVDDFRRHRAHYDVTVMSKTMPVDVAWFSFNRNKAYRHKMGLQPLPSFPNWMNESQVLNLFLYMTDIHVQARMS